MQESPLEEKLRKKKAKIMDNEKNSNECVWLFIVQVINFS